MPRDKTVTRTLLIFFIFVNFVFGAPVGAREKLEVGIDVDGTEDGTAALQKRVNPVDEGSTNMADQTTSSPDRTEVDRLWQEMKEQGMFTDSPTPLRIPGWSTPPFSEGSSTGSNSHQSTPKQSPLPQNPEPPRPLPSLVQPPPKLEPHPPAPAEIPIDEFLDILMKGKTKPPNPAQPPLNPVPRPLPNLVQPVPNPGPHPPAAGEMPIDEFLDMLMKGKRKRPSPVRPPPNPVPRPPPNPVQPVPNPGPHPPAAGEMPIDEFLDMLMKGKRKRPSPVRPPLNLRPPPLPNLMQPTPNLESHPPAAGKMPYMLTNGKMKPLNPVQPPPIPEPHPPATGEMPYMLTNGKMKPPNPVQPPPNPKPLPPMADEMPIDDFLDMLMKGKIKRTFLVPGAVDSARMDSRRLQKL